MPRYKLEPCTKDMFVNRHSWSCLDGEHSGGTKCLGRVRSIAVYKSGPFKGEPRALLVTQEGKDIILERNVIKDHFSDTKKLRGWCPSPQAGDGSVLAFALQVVFGHRTPGGRDKLSLDALNTLR